MIKYKWIESINSRVGMVSECLRFFGVASVEAWNEQYSKPIAAYRASPRFTTDTGAVSAWLRQCERKAGEIPSKPYDKAGFKQALSDLRELTCEPKPDVFVPKLVNICAEVGIAVVLEPTPPKCPLSGATRWIGQEKALLMLSLRHKTNDQLWFTFFHEAAHLLLHSKKLQFIELNDGLSDEQESEANNFARDLLIYPKAAQKLTNIPKTFVAVKEFAQQIGVAPGIVVGRMQREKLLQWSQLNGLKIKYSWVD